MCRAVARTGRGAPSHRSRTATVDEGAIDLRDVRGQAIARRALEIAAAGGHNLLFLGSPGAGKTMLARRLPTIVPPMGFEERLETSIVASVAGLLPADRPLVAERPSARPTTVSGVALTGGGPAARPVRSPRAPRCALPRDGSRVSPRRP
ncbi:MAG: ATP-binding protein [bacterium]